MKKTINISDKKLRNIISETIRKVLTESRKGENIQYKGRNIHIECYDMYNETDYEFIKNNINTIWQILQEGYANIGGFKGFQSKKQLLSRAPMVKLGFLDNEIIAVDVFNSYHLCLLFFS